MVAIIHLIGIWKSTASQSCMRLLCLYASVLQTWNDCCGTLGTRKMQEVGEDTSLQDGLPLWFIQHNYCCFEGWCDPATGGSDDFSPADRVIYWQKVSWLPFLCMVQVLEGPGNAFCSHISRLVTTSGLNSVTVYCLCCLSLRRLYVLVCYSLSWNL